MNWNDRIYFGTWQLSGQFKPFTTVQIEDLIYTALSQNIYKFDTAAVYGQGNVEKILGVCLPQEAVILTKIPAILKPEVNTPINECYSRDTLYRSVEGSLQRLRRNSLDTVLLHNWLPSWQEEALNVLDILAELKRQGITRRVGISIPNGFSGSLSNEVLKYVDVIEAPQNPDEQWVTSQLSLFSKLGKEVLLRSLFIQGKLLIATDKQSAVQKILSVALELNTSVVIGMTTTDQITRNINYLKGVTK